MENWSAVTYGWTIGAAYCMTVGVVTGHLYFVLVTCLRDWTCRAAVFRLELLRDGFPADPPTDVEWGTTGIPRGAFRRFAGLHLATAGLRPGARLGRGPPRPGSDSRGGAPLR